MTRIGAILTVVLLAGCGDVPSPDEDSSATTGRTAPLVTIEELDQLVDRLQVEHPSLALEDPDFSLLLTDEARELRRSARLRTESYELGGTHLTDAEFYLLASHPWWVKKTRECADDAKARAMVVFPGSQYRTRADAFRHSYWNVLMSKRIAPWWAREFATAHEAESSGIDRAMDLHNNQVGRSIYDAHRTASEPSLSAYVQTHCYTYTPTEPQLNAAPAGCLVFVTY